MKKLYYWFVLTIFSIMNICFLDKAFQYTVAILEDSDIENVSGVLFLPLVLYFCIGVSILVNIFMFLTNFFYLYDQNIEFSNVLLHKDNHILRKVVKIIGYLFIILYMCLCFKSFGESNYNAVIAGLSSIVISIILIIWIDAIIVKAINKNK